MTKTILLLLCATVANPSLACLWVAGTTKEGNRISVSGRLPALALKHSLHTTPEQYAIDRSIASLGATALERRNNIAVDLIYRNELPQAIEALKELEAEQPGDYITAANLGTAHELAGDNHEALRWITEAIRRNPMSHHGTEWLHVKILEAKIKVADDPEYFSTHSVLDMDHRQILSLDSQLVAGGEKRRVLEIAEALNYQLRERLLFVKSNDPSVASLLYDYAAIEAATRTLESACELLKMAARFGYPQTRIQPLLTQYEHTIFFATLKRWLLYSTIGIIVILFLIYAFQRRWMVFSRKDLKSSQPVRMLDGA